MPRTKARGIFACNGFSSFLADGRPGKVQRFDSYVQGAAPSVDTEDCIIAHALYFLTEENKDRKKIVR